MAGGRGFLSNGWHRTVSLLHLLCWLLGSCSNALDLRFTGCLCSQQGVIVVLSVHLAQDPLPASFDMFGFVSFADAVLFCLSGSSVVPSKAIWHRTLWMLPLLYWSNGITSPSRRKRRCSYRHHRTPSKGKHPAYIPTTSGHLPAGLLWHLRMAFCAVVFV